MKKVDETGRKNCHLHYYFIHLVMSRSLLFLNFPLDFTVSVFVSVCASVALQESRGQMWKDAPGDTIHTCHSPPPLFSGLLYFSVNIFAQAILRLLLHILPSHSLLTFCIFRFFFVYSFIYFFYANHFSPAPL